MQTLPLQQAGDISGSLLFRSGEAGAPGFATEPNGSFAQALSLLLAGAREDAPGGAMAAGNMSHRDGNVLELPEGLSPAGAQAGSPWRFDQAIAGLLAALDAVPEGETQGLGLAVEGLADWLEQLPDGVVDGAALGDSAEALKAMLGEAADRLQDLVQANPSLEHTLSELVAGLRDLAARLEIPAAVQDLAEDAEAMADEAGDALHSLLAQLLPQLESALRSWSNSGNTLPPAAVDESSEAQLDPAMTQRSWQDIARMLLGIRPSEDARSQTQTPFAEVPGGPFSVKASVEQVPAAGDELEFLLADKVAHTSLNEQDRLLQAVQQWRQAESTPGSALASTPAPTLAGLTASAPAALQAGLGSASVQAGSPLPAPIDIAPGEEAWGRALGERVVWMLGRDVQSAEIRLNPPQLGPVEIRVALQNDQASVTFTAQHPFTREALEAAIPRLREMLGDANLNLVNVDVGQRDTGESRNGGRGDAGSGGGGDGFGAGGTELAAAQAGGAPAARVLSGLVDDFA